MATPGQHAGRIVWAHYERLACNKEELLVVRDEIRIAIEQAIAAERERCARIACDAIGKCMKHEVLTTSHHPDCEAIRAKIREAGDRTNA